MKSGCVRQTYLGFEERSAGISAEADAVAAFTFGDGADAIGSETQFGAGSVSSAWNTVVAREPPVVPDFRARACGGRPVG